jgi:hypothetical protein
LNRDKRDILPFGYVDIDFQRPGYRPIRDLLVLLKSPSELDQAYNASFIQHSGCEVRRRILSHADLDNFDFIVFNSSPVPSTRRENGKPLYALTLVRIRDLPIRATGRPKQPERDPLPNPGLDTVQWMLLTMSQTLRIG